MQLLTGLSDLVVSCVEDGDEGVHQDQDHKADEEPVEPLPHHRVHHGEVIKPQAVPYQHVDLRREEIPRPFEAVPRLTEENHTAEAKGHEADEQKDAESNQSRACEGKHAPEEGDPRVEVEELERLHHRDEHRDRL